MAESILAGASRLELEDGRQLRLLSAFEVLQARREARWMARGEREQALCSNACLLARALERDGAPVFRSGGEVLSALTVEEIGSLAGMWWRFNREENPSERDGEKRVEQLKKVWSTRRRSGFTGACSGPSGRCPQRRASER